MVDLYLIGGYISCISNRYFHKKYCAEGWSSQIETNTKAELGQIFEQFDMRGKEVVVLRVAKVIYVEQSYRLVLSERISPLILDLYLTIISLIMTTQIINSKL